jgi:hypothetical protein
MGIEMNKKIKTLVMVICAALVVVSGESFAKKKELHSDFIEYKGSDLKKYKQLMATIPFVKFKNDGSDKNQRRKKSINYLYFTKNGEIFNFVPYVYFAKNVDKLRGFNKEGLLFENTLHFNDLYDEFVMLRNPISKEKKKEQIYSEVKINIEKAEYSQIFNFDYYSAISIKDVKKYNTKKMEQGVMFDFNERSPNAKILCEKDGYKYGYFSAKAQKVGKKEINSYVQNTPIYLELSDELKDSLSHKINDLGLPLCEYTKKFVDLDKAEFFINNINHGLNKFIMVFELFDSDGRRTYMGGKLKHLSYTVYDGKRFNFETDRQTGVNYEGVVDIPVDIADKRLLRDLSTKKRIAFSSEKIKERHYAYNIGDDLYFKMYEENKAYVFSTKNRFLGKYDVQFNGKDISLSLSRIVREYDYNFPRKILIYRMDDTYEYMADVLFNLKMRYKSNNIDLQKHIVMDEKKMLSIP